jgi:hypothetical protein
VAPKTYVSCHGRKRIPSQPLRPVGGYPVGIIRFGLYPQEPDP